MKKNAIMSKKLETAGGRLFGLDVDLVNLRKEVYDGQTRNPDMEFGTAQEDAFRRDATVNALFYNLKKQQVVDPTGRGLKDLDAKIMRRPLDPMQTFMDDPLRVLRLIRVGKYETGGGHDAESSRDAHARKTAWDKYSAFADFIFRHNLRNAHSLGPLLNGREIQELFGLKGGGKYLKDVMDKLVEWQFDNEDATKEECEAWLLQQRDWLCAR
ncbi:hypothetical protein MY1884_003951 [Beauveria asiatica]